MARAAAQGALPGIGNGAKRGLRGKNVLAKHVWTLEEHGVLREMYARGDLTKNIADHFGVTERAVQGQAWRLSLRHKSRSLSLAERFAEHVVGEPNSGCLLWLGALTSAGRPSMHVGLETLVGTHVALRLAGIAIPPGLLVLHRCDNPICVNPGHLYFGSHTDNQRDARGKGLPGSRISPDECVKGHLLTGDNLVVYASGVRVCRECRNRNARLWRARQAMQL